MKVSDPGENPTFAAPGAHGPTRTVSTHVEGDYDGWLGFSELRRWDCVLFFRSLPDFTIGGRLVVVPRLYTC